VPSADLLAEADRQLTVCNACRYCEGYCAVFPAMELRRTFTNDDIIYMANLCFECRACYYACPYTEPQEYKLNIPEILSAVRVETYAEYTGPRVLSKLFAGNGTMVGLATTLIIALVFGSVLLIQGGDVIFTANNEEGSFFEVIPYLAMTIPALGLSSYFMAAFAFGAMKFWRETKGNLSQTIDAQSFLKASKDAFGLEYMRGGGQGCNYPDERWSQSRRWFHHLVLWGFVLDFISTSLAAYYHNILHWDPPYDYLSPPVVLGTIGGVMLAIGVVGLLWLKRISDRTPSHAPMLKLDVVFLWLLLATSLSGLVLMLMRETAAMGSLLIIHLGIVAALYLTLPYGKFAHVVYRYAALVKYQIEQKQAAYKAGH